MTDHTAIVARLRMQACLGYVDDDVVPFIESLVAERDALREECERLRAGEECERLRADLHNARLGYKDVS